MQKYTKFRITTALFRINFSTRIFVDTFRKNIEEISMQYMRQPQQQRRIA